MIKQVSHTHIKYHPSKHTKSIDQEAKEIAKRSKALSIEAYDLYTFSPFGNKLPKSSKMHSAIRHSKHDLQELRSAKMAWREQHL